MSVLRLTQSPPEAMELPAPVLVLLFAVAQLVIATSLPFPVIESDELLPDESTADKFVYYEKKTVTLRCSLPVPLPEDTELKISYRVDVKNPIFVNEKVYDSGPIKGKDSITLSLFYTYNYIPLITVWCEAKEKNTLITKITSKVTLEQKFATGAVKIIGDAARSVEPGKEAVLQCVADGNPPPQYQWFNNDFTELKQIDGANESTYKFKMPTNVTKYSKYKCGAKNKYNSDFVMNKKYGYVVSTYVPSPVIELLTPPYNQESYKFFYMETHNISLRCTLPPPAFDDLVLEVWFKPTGNPFFEVVSAFGFTVNSTGEPHSKITVVTPYKDGLLAPTMEVTCYSIQGPGWDIWSKTTILIDQEFKTANVAIVSDFPDGVAAGDTVRLICLADGYPFPEEFQWYKLSNNGSKVTLNCSTRLCKFHTPERPSAEEEYVCATKNKYNIDNVESDPRKVITTSFPFPVIESVSLRSNESTTDKFVYYEKKKVTLRCSLPVPLLADTRLTISYREEVKNPVSNYEVFVSFEEEGKDSITVSFDYLSAYIPLITVWCRAEKKNPKFTKSTSKVTLEQKFATQAVQIEGKTSESVKPGDEAVLQCVADGNPPPQYQWFTLGKDFIDWEPIDGATESTYKFMMPTNETKRGKYKCGAKNEFNADFVMTRYPYEVKST